MPKAKKSHPRTAGAPDIEIGRRIRLRRVEIGISQSELGTRLGVSFQQVQKYEKGVNKVATSRMSEIAKVLDVPVTFFFGNATNGGGNTASQQAEVESLMFSDSRFTLRLLRAYNIMDQGTARCFVSLAESVAGIGKE